MPIKIETGCPTCGNEVTLDPWSHKELVCAECQTWICRRCIEEGMPHTHGAKTRCAAWKVIPNPDLKGAGA